MEDEVEVDEFPDCDIHKYVQEKREAHYDAKTKDGYWAFMCDDCMARHGVGVGLGKGQRLVLKAT